MPTSMIRIVLALLSAACTACTCAAPGPSATPDTLARIVSLIGPAACTGATQCRTIGVGERPCGGPENYLAWSVTSIDPAALRLLVERYREERQAANARSGEQSTCNILPDPGAVCVAGQCRPGGRDRDPA